MKGTIFQNPTNSVPQSDRQIVRVPMDQNEIGGRKDHLPPTRVDPEAGIKHVPNEG